MWNQWMSYGTDLLLRLIYNPITYTTYTINLYCCQISDIIVKKDISQVNIKEGLECQGQVGSLKSSLQLKSSELTLHKHSEA